MNFNHAQPKLQEKDLKILKDQIRLIHGLEIPKKQQLRAVCSKRRAVRHSSNIVTKVNKTSISRQQCTKKRMKNLSADESAEINELERMHRLNLIKKKKILFKLNEAFRLRWKNIRGKPVIHSFFRQTFLDTGKPPFVVPVHYKPFNVYWDADWAREEFIFLGNDDEHKESEKSNSSTTSATSTTSTSSKPSTTTEQMKDMNENINVEVESTSTTTRSMTRATLDDFD